MSSGTQDRHRRLTAPLAAWLDLNPYQGCREWPPRVHIRWPAWPRSPRVLPARPCVPPAPGTPDKRSPAPVFTADFPGPLSGASHTGQKHGTSETQGQEAERNGGGTSPLRAQLVPLREGQRPRRRFTVWWAQCLQDRAPFQAGRR